MHIFFVSSTQCVFFSFLSSTKLKQILWDYITMEKLPLVKYCKPSNFQISANFTNSPLSQLHHPDMHALIHQKDFLPPSFFLSTHSFLVSVQSIICLIFLCFVLLCFWCFSFPLFYRHWQFSRPDESPVDWRLDRLHRHSLNTTRSRWAAMDKCSWEIQMKNTVQKQKH